jgi:hypothetical protein
LSKINKSISRRKATSQATTSFKMQQKQQQVFAMSNSTKKPPKPEPQHHRSLHIDPQLVVLVGALSVKRSSKIATPHSTKASKASYDQGAIVSILALLARMDPFINSTTQHSLEHHTSPFILASKASQQQHCTGEEHIHPPINHQTICQSHVF